MKTSNKIINYIKSKNQASGKELAEFLNISDRAVRKQLSALLKTGKLSKVGRPPRVFYLLNKQIKAEKITIDSKKKKIIDDNYLIITPTGEKKMGEEGFVYWCRKNNLPVDKTINEYIDTLAKYKRYKKHGIISGLAKFKRTFNSVYLDKVFYLDFYSIERFGKTKLGQLLLYGKQSGNKQIIKMIAEEVKPLINQIIKRHRIDGIGFIPWTVKREIQFIKELEKNLSLKIKTINITKVKTEIIVPQKTLSKLNDRVENAKNTLIVTDNGEYDNILLIDDAVGSGATLNEVAKQIKKRKIAKKVIGLSLTGSFKGFDVISEI